jgi:CBS domain-containing membrane protein
MTITEERSLDLDLDHAGRGDKAHPVARVAVVGTMGFTRDGADATISLDCESSAALEREVERLHAELDDALERGLQLLNGNARAAASRRATRKPRAAAADAPAPARPRLSVPWTVAELMTRTVKTVGANEPAAAAKQAMDAGGFRHLVVVGEDGEIEGVLSQRDLFFGPLAWSIGQGLAGYEKLLQAARVKDVMHTDVATVEPGSPLTEAAALLREKKVGCLPVVEGDRLVGLITEGDFVAWVADATP